MLHKVFASNVFAALLPDKDAEGVGRNMGREWQRRSAVVVAAVLLRAASVAGKLIGIQLAGRGLKWQPGEASIIGWLPQTVAPRPSRMKERVLRSTRCPALRPLRVTPACL
jgi:hypothetical protein